MVPISRAHGRGLPGEAGSPTGGGAWAGAGRVSGAELPTKTCMAMARIAWN